MSKTIKIPGRIESAEMGGIVAGAGAIMDDLKNKRQSEVNAEVDEALAGLGEGKQDVLTFDNEPTENSNNPVKSGGVYAADLALSQAIEAILLLIPSAASALNQLADKAFVNSTEATNTATFRGTFNVVSGLGLAYNATHEQIAAALLTHIATADNNDYSFVQIPVSGTSSDIAKTERYKFNGEAWGYEYDLNNSGYTQAQWDAINSTITLALVQKLSLLPTAAELQQSFNAKQDNLTFDTTPTAGSTNPVTSGGVKTELNVLNVAVSAVQLALDALTGRVTTAEGDIATNTATIEVLQSIYVALTQSALVIVDTTDTWPVENPATETIYRVVDRENTPPQYYSDYIWNGTAMVLLAKYNNAIDDKPTPGSNNLVKSGGVYDYAKKGLTFERDDFQSGYYAEDGYHAWESTMSTKKNYCVPSGNYRISINSNYNCYIVASNNFNEENSFRRIRSLGNLSNDEILNNGITENITEKYIRVTITKSDFSAMSEADITMADLKLFKLDTSVKEARVTNNVIASNGTITSVLEGYKGIIANCEAETNYSFLCNNIESIAFFDKESPYIGTMLGFREINSNSFKTPSGCKCFFANINIVNPDMELNDAIPYIKGNMDVIKNSNILHYSCFKNGNMTEDGYYYDNIVWCTKNPVLLNRNTRYRVGIKNTCYVYLVGKRSLADSYYTRISSPDGHEYFSNGDVFETDCRYIWATIAKTDFPNSSVSYNDLKNCDAKITEVEEVPTFACNSEAKKGVKIFGGSHDWVDVYNESGSGILQNMFFAGGFPTAKRTEVRVICDGELSLGGYIFELAGLPAALEIDVSQVVFGNEFFGKTGAENGIYLNYKIPYTKNIKIRLRNLDYDENPYFWFSCRTIGWRDFHIGDIKIPYGAKFRCIREEHIGVPSGDEIVLLQKKKGQNACVFGTILFAVGRSSMWYLEGMTRDYKNDSASPMLISSGLEDYFLGTYYFERGTYQLPIAGCNYLNNDNNEIAAYRLHYNDNWLLDQNKHVITLRNNDLNTEDAESIQNPTIADYAVYFMYYIW